MNHWGWYWKYRKKHDKKTVCSSLMSIDSFELHKKNALYGFTVQPVNVLAMRSGDKLTISYGKQSHKSYQIAIDALPCYYGGFRYYFKCPLCQSRMRFLYFAQKSIFLCRKCLNLGYESQRLRPMLRYNHMSNKVKALIRKRGGDLDAHQKPPRMHKESYQRLKSKQFYYEHKSAQASNAELRLWFGAKIEPHLDEYFDYVDESKEWRRK